MTNHVGNWWASRFNGSSRIAIAISVVALGCAFAIGISAHRASTRADQNTCAIQAFLQTNKERSLELKLPNYQESVDQLTLIQAQLNPTLQTCYDDGIIDPPTTAE